MVLAPPVAFAIWGGSYLLDCVHALEAPGIPVRFGYRSPGGVVTFTASSYVFDWESGSLLLYRPALTNPKGGSLASVDMVKVDGLRTLLGEDKAVRVRANGVRAQLVRLPTGKFEIESYLPPKTTREGGVPFEVELTDVAVDLVDTMGTRPYRQPVRTSVVRVAGVGDDWIAGTNVNAPGIGFASVSVQNVADAGLHLSVRARELELAPLVAHLLTTKQFRDSDFADLRARSLRVVGPMRLYLPKEKAARIESRLVLRGEDVRFQDYAVDRATFRGVLNEAGIQGVLDAVTGGVRGRFDGSAILEKEAIRAAGIVNVSVAGVRDLPLWARKELPADVGFEDARFNGWLAYGAKGAYRVSGDARAVRARYGNEVVENADIGVRARPDRVVLNVRNARYGGELATGIVAIDPKGRTLSGAVQASSVDIGVLARRFGFEGLSGEAALAATLGGTFGKPAIEVTARGDATYAQDGRKVPIGKFELDGRFLDGALQVRRGVVRGPLGLLAANGSIGTGGDALGIGIVGRRLDPSLLLPELDGQGNLVAQVGGTLKDPVATGYVEAYNVRYGETLIPAVRADIVADRKRVALRGVRATSGTAEVTGEGSLTYADRRLAGNFRAQGVQLADIAQGREDLAGAIDVPKLSIAGTLSDPRLTAAISGEDLVVRGAKIDSIAAQVRANRREVVLEDATASANGGTLQVAGRYDIRARGGRVTGEATNLALDPLARQISSEVTLDGTVSGRASVGFDVRGLTGLEGSGQLSSVKVNGTSLGDGPWSVSRTGTTYLADLRVGTLERYVELEKVRFDPESQTASGTAWMHNVLTQDLVSIGDRYFATLSPEARQAIREVQGTINVGAEFSGSTKSPSLNVDNLEVTGLKYREVDLGALTASIGVTDRRWDVRQLALNGPLGTANVKGSVEEQGATSLSGEVKGISLLELGRAIPGAGAAGGYLSDFSFKVSGLTKSPSLEASADFTGLLAPPDQRDSGLSISLYPININETGGISIGGRYAYRGFTGLITGSAPFEYPFRIPGEGQVSARISLDNRNLADIADYFPSLDAKRTKGEVSGEIVAQGKTDALTYSGELSLNAERIGFLLPPNIPFSDEPSKDPIPVADTLQNVFASIKLGGGDLGFNARANSSRGGSFSANVSTPLGQLGRLASTLREEGATGLLASALTGDVTFDKLSVRQGLPGGSYVAGTVAGAIQVDGTLRRPRLSTAEPIVLSRVDSVLPTFASREGQSEPATINPRFDMRLTLADPARLRTTAAELFVLGDGTVQGTLAYPDVRGQLEVERGTLTLPGGRVRLEQGGTVAVQFTSTQNDSTARADVDLEGRTAITALRFGTTYERYDITLGVKGDLLREGGLNLTASSDPPDLSRDRILALLGQTDLIEAIGTNLGSSGTERRIRDALAGYALPALADPITSRLAQGLGLDYLNLEYNPLEEASLAFAKSIGGGFFIQGRRQISDPPPGFPAQYDVRLVYRPRRLRGALSRISFSIGADEETPLKIAIEYGVRF
ncbi:MAG: translocation/assembly module TamB domain-containing protein [Fimbriimonas sp.]